MVALRSRKQLKQRAESRFQFTGVWKDVFGCPTTTGLWLIYGEEKHGKTMLSLMVGNYLSKFKRVLYVSGEEGLDDDFQDAIKRAQVTEYDRRYLFSDMIELNDLESLLSRRNAPKVVIIDNVTVYVDQLAYGKLRELHQKYKSSVLFIFIAHEENNQPYTSTAKLAKRLAKVIIRVEGLAGFVGGRVPGGKILINEEKAMLYHGSQIKDNQ